MSQKFLDFARGVQKVVAEIIRYPGGCLMISGPVSLDCHEGDELAEHYEEPGEFEQFYAAHHIHEKG